MKRLLTAALCQLAAAAGSSKCKLRTGTINKGMRNRVCICTCKFVYAGVHQCVVTCVHYMLVLLSALCNNNKNRTGKVNLTSHTVWAEFCQNKDGISRSRIISKPINCKVRHSNWRGNWHENVSKLAHLLNIPKVYQRRLDTWNSCFLQKSLIRKICFCIHCVHVLLLAGNEVDSNSQWCRWLDPTSMQHTHTDLLQTNTHILKLICLHSMLPWVINH